MTETPLTLEEMERRILGMSPEQRRELERVAKPFLEKCWLHQPGPQTEAFYTTAEETLYGGAAGGGKSDLLLGLATTAHLKSVIFRRQSVDLDGLWNRLAEIVAGHVRKSDANKKRLRTTDNRLIEFGHLEKPGSEKSWQGRDHDLYGFDEAAQMDERKVSFVIQWLRSTTEGQRARIVFATNPPMPEYDRNGNLIDSGGGQWLKDWFAPWLDDMFRNPAKPGEIRWCYMRTEGDRMTTVWVEGPGGYDPATGAAVSGYTQEDVDAGRVAVAKSRTFIKSLLKDNAFLKNTGYAARLSSTPEPLRSLLLTGSFTVKGEDHPYQIIPTQWVLLAQERWKAREAKGEFRHLRQLVISADIAQGGADSTVIGELLETDVFTEPTARPGHETPTGKEVTTMLLMRRRHGSLIVLDGTGGWGGSTRDKLRDDHEIDAEMCVSSEGSTEWTKDLTWKFLNLRAEMWWLFREDLDPDSGYDICLPPSSRLLTQLTAPHFIVKGKTLQVESKDDLRLRLGSSTDEADQILMAWHYRDQALAQLRFGRPDIVSRIVHGVTDEQFRQQQNQAVEQDDPLGDWR